MIEIVEGPKALGKERRGRVLMFTGCGTALRKEIRHPKSNLVAWDYDKRWSRGLYVWADVENEYGLRRNIGLLLPVKVLDTVLAEMQLPLMSQNRRHKRWAVEDDEDLPYINRLLVLQALNRHGYDIKWRCDDENGRIIYDLTIRDK